MKRVYYLYNPETDNYERVYRTWKDRIWSSAKILAFSLLGAVLIFLIAFYGFASPSEQSLRSENAQLKSQYNILNKRLANSLTIMEHIRDRDDNFYRVMLQMDPLSSSQRFAGLENEQRYKKLQNLSDAELITTLTRQMDLLERGIYAQSLSFDQLREKAVSQKEKLAHIPAIIPIHIKDYTLSSGYGIRIDPIYNEQKFHAGLDFAAAEGTPVYATADGVVTCADWIGGYGNCIDINHGYDYTTRFGHLSKFLVKNGQSVKRGQVIGLVGSTGKSTGPHLHYEVRFKDEPQNPVNYYFLDINAQQYEAMVRQAENAGNVMD